MKCTYFIATLLAGLLVITSSCTHEHGEDTHSHDNEIHGSHGDELEPLSFTVWTKKSELFVEFPPLIKDKESRFAAHFSDMLSFKAIQEGEVLVRLREQTRSILENSVSSPSSPGIFRPAITPVKTGIYSLDFFLKTSTVTDTITISDIMVYPDAEAAKAANPPMPEGDEISFSKEQAWKTEFGIAEVKRQRIHQVIRTSGEIQAVKGKEKIVSAKSSGIVFYKNNKLQVGREIQKGEPLFTISSQGLLQSNITEKFNVAEAKLEKAKANFERAESLLAEQIIGQKEYENRKMEYAVAKAEWQTFNNNDTGGGQTIFAPMSGIIKNLMISDGEFATEGTPLIEISDIRRLMLFADVPQDRSSSLSQIVTANFKTTYQDEVQSLSDYNGKLVSMGKVLEQGTHFLPVWFELDNINGLVPGSFVELFLLTKPHENQLVIPNSALMQDYNVNYVYVQTSGENFEKKEIQLGIDDGKNVQILSGISEGDWVVTKGAYQIKMASMSSTIPAHGHAH